MSRAGTPIYSAPEVIRCERYTPTMDVWGFGCLMAHVAARAAPGTGPKGKKAAQSGDDRETDI